ncbi:MAG: hypothetical protein AAFO61_06195 [Pseudomonadota bacterium]
MTVENPMLVVAAIAAFASLEWAGLLGFVIVTDKVRSRLTWRENASFWAMCLLFSIAGYQVAKLCLRGLFLEAVFPLASVAVALAAAPIIVWAFHRPRNLI